MSEIKPKIYDCFTFFNELDLLEIRLNELANVADFFVLVEANFTHQGNPKSYYFEENKSRYSSFLDKIIHIKVDDIPENDILNTDKNWNLEHFQRNAIERGLTLAHENDIIIISDIDEIPKKEIIKNITFNEKPIIILLMNFYYYFVDLQAKYSFSWKYYFLGKFLNITKYRYKHINNTFWQASVILKKKDLISPQHCRDLLKKYHFDVNYIKNSGWHFSYLGGIDKIITKLESFAHAEFNENKFKSKDFINTILKNKKVIHDKKLKLFKINNLELLPFTLTLNIQKFKHLFSENE
ncbi:MAG: hypothetical protein EAZ27_02560 [Cytophagales bacterium]|nr:MAG: hypothetical protein EAZ27_02560 [Cytophagales bacterium]